MIFRSKARLHVLILGCALASLAAFSQEKQIEPGKYVSPAARMAAAKTVFLRHVGSDIPFTVIQAGMESWPRYMIVDSPEKADLIIEVIAPKESTGTSVSSKVKTDSRSGETSSSTREFESIQTIKLTVLDAHTKVALFSATEKPKDSWHESVRTQSQIDCAQKLFHALRARVEPETAIPQPDAK
jgi:hypothetical protein